MGLFSWWRRKKAKPVAELSKPEADLRKLQMESTRSELSSLSKQQTFAKRPAVSQRRKDVRSLEVEDGIDLDMGDFDLPKTDHSYAKPGVPLHTPSSHSHHHSSYDSGNSHHSSSYDSGSSSSYDSGSCGGGDSGGGSCGGGGD